MGRKGRERGKASSSIHKQVVACHPHRRGTPSLYANYVGLPTRATPILARSLPPILPTPHRALPHSNLTLLHRFLLHSPLRIPALLCPPAFPDTSPSCIPSCP